MWAFISGVTEVLSGSQMFVETLVCETILNVRVMNQVARDMHKVLHQIYLINAIDIFKFSPNANLLIQILTKCNPGEMIWEFGFFLRPLALIDESNIQIFVCRDELAIRINELIHLFGEQWDLDHLLELKEF